MKMMLVISTRLDLFRLNKSNGILLSSLGVKRPAEHSQSHPADDGNSNVKNNPSSRSHPNDRRTDNRYDSENNSSK